MFYVANKLIQYNKRCQFQAELDNWLQGQTTHDLSAATNHDIDCQFSTACEKIRRTRGLFQMLVLNNMFTFLRIVLV